jgi:hypothetical protein
MIAVLFNPWRGGPLRRRKKNWEMEKEKSREHNVEINIHGWTDDIGGEKKNWG